MSRYNSNYGSHDQLQDLRKLNMEVMRERDAANRRIIELETRVQNLEAVLKLAQTLLDLD